MNVEVRWFIELPFDITCNNSFYNTRLTQYDFEFEEIKIKFKKDNDKEIVRSIIVSCNHEYNDDFYPSHKNLDYLDVFLQQVTLKAGLITQRFMDGISKATNNEPLIVFDGEDFSCKYEMNVSNGIMSGAGDNDRESCNINDEEMQKAISFTNRTNTHLDSAWYLLREIEVSYEMGKYELCFLNMAIMAELLVTSVLDNYLCGNGRFKSQYRNELITLYGHRPSFVNKYFRFGLSLVSNKVIESDVIDSVDFIYKVRDKIAHGNTLYTIQVLTDNCIDVSNIRDVVWNLYNDMIDVYNYFYELEEELNQLATDD